MRRVLSVLLIFVALPLSAAKGPAWVEPYNRAMSAVGKQDWAAAADALQKSLAVKGDEELNANNGTGTINYLPHYWLGVARLNLGDAAAALTSLKRSESQGVIQRTDQYASFRKALSRADQLKRAGTGPDLKALRSAADQALANALAAQAMATAAGSSRRSEYEVAGRKVDQALAALRGSPDAAQLQSAARLAEEAAQLYDSISKAPAKPVAVRREVTPTPAPAMTTPTPAVREPETAPIPPLEPPRPAGPSAAEKERVKTQLRALENETDAAARKNSSPAVAVVAANARRSAAGWRAEIDGGAGSERLRAISADISRRREEIRDIAATAGEAASTSGADQYRQRLRGAYEAATRGQLQEAQSMLDALLAEDNTRGAAYALRGWVRYTRALLGEPGTLTKDAEADFAAALRLDPSLRLDGRHFSPKVIALFDQTRQRIQ